VEDHFAARLSDAPRLPKTRNVAYEPTLPRDTARSLRANATEAEQKLWSRLRTKQLDGFQFRRQYSIGPFFVDFICLEADLIIEVDGSQHAEQEQRDERRSAFLRAYGCQVLRFWNFEVMSDVDSVVERIAEVLRQTPRRGKQGR
jgi:very-short-patch-repair endonuclease